MWSIINRADRYFAVLNPSRLPRHAGRGLIRLYRYTLSPLGMVARMMMGPPALFERVAPRFGVRRNDGQPRPARMTPARKRVLDVADDGLIRAKGALASQAGCSAAVIDSLLAAGALVEVEILERRFPAPNPAHSATAFSQAQAEAVAAMRAAGDAF